MATYLVAGHHLPLDRAARVLSDLLAAPVSPGSVAAWSTAAAGRPTPFTNGAQAFCTLRSYLATAAQQRRAALEVLRQLHQGQPWLPEPRAPAEPADQLPSGTTR